MDHRAIAGNKFLGGLAANFGAERVLKASWSALGYPAHMVTTHDEARQILTKLEEDDEVQTA